MREFKCSACQQTFQTAGTEEDARKEYEANFGHYAIEDESPDVVCCDCYEEFWKWAEDEALELKRIM